MKDKSELKANLNILLRMVTSLYTADVKLNATDKDYKKYIIIQNEEGVLMVDKGLYSLSFINEEAVLLANVEIKNKKHIGDITL